MGKYLLTYKPINPVVGDLVMDTTLNRMIIFNGVTWDILPDTIRYCIKCRVAEWNHWKVETGGHPFIGNNLELLEHEYAKKALGSK